MELIQGSLRYYYSLCQQVNAHLSKPLRDKDQDIFSLLIVGTYQLKHMRTPDHAAIHETVGAVSQLKRPWAKGLVNAVLRKVASTAPNDHSVELPDWIIERFETDFPQQASQLGVAAVERAPMSLRVNAARMSPADYLQQLTSAGIRAHTGHCAEHLILSNPVPARDLPGFREGLVSIQDAGAQLAAYLAPADLPATARILDACAAPGGKLFHLAERFQQADATGVELSQDRLEHMRGEAARLGHEQVHLIGGDATGRDWLASAGSAGLPCFDLILLDAPCTGSGTLRRHPDIKILRTPADVASAAELQGRLLDNLWPLLAEGGTFIYCTCSLFAEENDQVIEAFIRRTADDPVKPTAEVTPVVLPTGTATRFGWQLLPLPGGSETPNRSVDGFYFARMTRQEKAR